MTQYSLSDRQQEYVDHVRSTAKSLTQRLAPASGHDGRVDRPLLREPVTSASPAAAMPLCLLRETLAQLHTAAETARGYLLEHLYREVRAPRIYEGASEVQRTIIGRALVRAAQKSERKGER
jgi:acyl-CoA dehydrogenase